MASETREHAERLQAMSEDDGETWDLSENDQAACKAGAAALRASLSREDREQALNLAIPEEDPHDDKDEQGRCVRCEQIGQARRLLQLDPTPTEDR